MLMSVLSVLSANVFANVVLNDQMIWPEVLAQFDQHTDAIEFNSQNQIRYRSDSQYHYIESNSIPSHQPGRFPNRGNPHRIKAQSIQLKVPKTPQPITKPINNSGYIAGVALNGVLFEPSTAECYGGRRNLKCLWREEAIVNQVSSLGLDQNNAHVQPTGLYHYHALPVGLIQQLQHFNRHDIILVGYAADGYPLLFDPKALYRSSYRLRSGFRTGDDAPAGRYDGTYTADFEYKANSGNLDECNGAKIDGHYAYFFTESFPYMPRCFNAKPDDSFKKKRRPRKRRQ